MAHKGILIKLVFFFHFADLFIALTVFFSEEFALIMCVRHTRGVTTLSDINLVNIDFP